MFQIIKSKDFTKWFEKIRDIRLKNIITDRLHRFEDGNLGDVKPVGDGVSEARIHSGAGYRLYFVKHGDVLIVMLAGGDKSSQTADIKKAKKLAEEWE